MYIPSHFREPDSDAALALIERHPFATLVSTIEGVPFATHLPLLLDRHAGVLLGHFARANPHAAALFDAGEALAIFGGAHAYISPRWYVSPNVPTWNYAVVHVYGRAQRMDDAQLERLLSQLTARFEDPADAWTATELPAGMAEKMRRAVVGFTLPLTRIEAKSKLSQNRTAADVRGAIEALEARGEREVAMLMRTALERNGG